MGQYFDYNPNLKSDIHEIKYTFKGKELSFSVDNGVFSKNQVDFGTNVLLNSLPDFENEKRILDMGCGYGVIGLCLAKAYPTSLITMVDVNLKAVELSKSNAKNNHITNASIICSNLYEYQNEVNEEYDAIITNPPIRAGKKVVHGIVINGFKYLKKCGKILLVIQKKQGAPSMEKLLFDVFGNVKTLEKKNGYYIFESVKEV